MDQGASSTAHGVAFSMSGPEHLWSLRKKRKISQYNDVRSSMKVFQTGTPEQRVGVGSQVCQELVESVPRRSDAVIKAKGGHTKY